MRLVSLELAGFKSFANRTRVRFEPGLTGIVGPNGCGKSNIVDALKWVLGTLSTKAMRAEEMADVIFKGADGTGPSGFAEVLLAFDNSDRGLSLDANEVTLGRRLYRSGDSEYTINGASVRLKDVRDLMAGTGVGPGSYAIIEQGRIDRLVLADPHERRVIFDEAAGVSRYRLKRHETELRLAHVDQDLARAGDVLGEVQRELHGLRTQAGRAQKYRELMEHLRQRSIRLLVIEAVEQQRILDDAAFRRVDLERERDETRARLDQLRREIDEADARLRDAELEVERTRAERERALGRAADLDAQLAQAKARRERLEEDIRAAEGESARLTDRRAKIDEQRTALRRDRDAEEARLAETTRALEEGGGRVEQARAACAEADATVERIRSNLIELARRETSYQNEAEAAGREAESLRARSERLARRASEIDANRARLDGEVARLDGELETIERDLAAWEEERRRREAESVLWTDRAAQREAAVSEILDRRNDARSRARALAEVGEEASPVAEIRAAVPGVIGLVADVLAADLPNARAVEAALGERATYVVVESWTDVQAAAQWVRGADGGRVGFLPAQGLAPERRHPLWRGVVGMAADLVRAAEGCRSLAERLLGGTLVAATAEDARTVLAAGLWSGPVVTLEGERYEPDGSVVTAGPRSARGPVSRRAELRDLSAREAELDRTRAELEAGRDEARAERDRAGERRDAARQAIYERSVRRQETAAERDQALRQRSLVEKEREALRLEEEEAVRGISDGETRRTRAAVLAEEVRAVRAEAEQELARWIERRAVYEEGRGKLEEEWAKLREAAARAQEKVASYDEQAALLERELAGAREAAAHAAKRHDEMCERREEAGKEAERLQGERREATERAAALEAERAAAEERRERARTDAASRRQERETLESVLAQKESALHELDLSLADARSRRAQLVERASAEFETTLEAAREACPDAKPEEREGLAEEVRALKERIQRFGPVNVLALDRLKEVEEREHFLRTQIEDLKGSKQRLEELIKSLNVEAKEKFEQTLARVSENFSNLFRKLFGGGKTEIQVVAEENVDPSEWGVEIFARPPRKETAKLSLLSGGERSLTAVALALALFQANPSPFCILDEADSALDESNVERFAGLLQECVASAQFIVITHNKRTMSAVDLLYGISMERPGISKMVTVDFRNGKAAEPAAAAAAT